MPTAKNWLILIKFDGTRYHGWQVQPNSSTIERTVEKAVEKLTGEFVEVHGAGRTDSGVHALNFTANFRSSTANFKNPENWRKALNAVLPNDIVVKCIRTVPKKFHARHSAIGKRYRYLINNLPYNSAFSQNHSWWINKNLDIKLMREAATVLVGENDFSAFRSTNCTSTNPIKNLKEISIKKKFSYFSTIQIEFEANSFLQHMVRIITGTLVEVGLGKRRISDLYLALESGQRKLAGVTAPAYGLYSLKVIYPKGMINWPKEVIDV